jgi:hypothetical protein
LSPWYIWLEYKKTCKIPNSVLDFELPHKKSKQKEGASF